MDFEKIKPAVEDITLSEAQKQAIIAGCAKEKKKSRAPIYAIAAAAAVIIIVAVSPGFLLRAGNADKSSDCNYAAADQEMAQSTATGDFVLFEADGYADIYSVIPAEFVSLVDYVEFSEWSAECSAEGGMALMQFAERFNITKENFEIANEEYKSRNGSEPSGDIAYGASGATADVINTELIYSFDKAKIDDFYKK